MTASVTVTISRTSLSLPDLVMTATPGDSGLGVSAFQAPGRVARITYMPDSVDIHGSEPIASSWQEGLISFNVVTDDVASETEAQTALAALVAALGQFSYAVTTQVSGAPAQAWAARMGSFSQPSRSLTDLETSLYECAVTIPVYPIAS